MVWGVGGLYTLYPTSYTPYRAVGSLFLLHHVRGDGHVGTWICDAYGGRTVLLDVPLFFTKASSPSE